MNEIDIETEIRYISDENNILESENESEYHIDIDRNKSISDKKDIDLFEQILKFNQKTKKNFDEFYKKYLPKLIYHNTKIVRDVEVAKDIAIEAILKSLQKIDDYDENRAGFSTWLFTISKNDSIQYVNKNRKFISVDKFVDEEGTTIKDFLNDNDIEDSKTREIQELDVLKGNIVKEKIKELKEPYRSVIEYRELDGKSYRDITIILKEESTLRIELSFFENNLYKDSILTLVDPEKKQNNELIKFLEINTIIDDGCNEIDFEVVERDKDGLISKIFIKKGSYSINGQVPFNMSTLKSQIRNGRLILRSLVDKEFEELDNLYL